MADKKLGIVRRFFKYWTEDRGIIFLLVSISILVFIIYPLFDNSDFSDKIVNMFVIIILFFGVFSIDVGLEFRKILLFALLIIVIIGIVGGLIDSNFITQFHISARILFLWMMIILIFKRVMGSKPITFFYRISGSITIYLLIGFIWANMYFMFYEFSPGSFHFNTPVLPDENLMFNFIYFSFVTLTTLGLGDILPLHPMLKSMVIVESVLGPLFLAILIGRLVSKQTLVKKEE